MSIPPFCQDCGRYVCKNCGAEFYTHEGWRVHACDPHAR